MTLSIPRLALGVASLVAWNIVLADPGWLEPRVQENGAVEWIGTAAFALGVAVLVLAAVWRGDARRYRIAAGVLGLVFFVALMEELSWGQAIFGWDTPDTFSGNMQGETNLHNNGWLLGGELDAQELFTLGILGLTVGVPLLARWGRGRALLDRAGLPVVSLWVSAWVLMTIVAAKVAEAAVGGRAPREVLELMYGVAVVLVAVAAVRGAAERTDRPVLTTAQRYSLIGAVAGVSIGLVMLPGNQPIQPPTHHVSTTTRGTP